MRAYRYTIKIHHLYSCVYICIRTTQNIQYKKYLIMVFNAIFLIILCSTQQVYSFSSRHVDDVNSVQRGYILL